MQLKLTRKSSDEETQDAPAAAITEVTAEEMNGKVKAEGLTGLDVSGSGIAAVKVSDGRVRSASLTTLDKGIIVDGEIADPAALGAALAEFFAATGMPNKVRMGVASPRVVIRTIE